MLCLVTNIKSFLIFPHLGSPKPDPAFQLFMNTWWYYYYSALLQINWNCHKALKSISPNPVLLHSLVLKIAAAVWQFSLNLSTCPKTGTLCVIHNNHAAGSERSVLTISLTTICACSLMRCWINPAVNDLTLTKFQKKQFYMVVMPSLGIAPVKPEWAVKRT